MKITTRAFVGFVGMLSAWVCPSAGFAETLFFTNQAGGDVGNYSADLTVASYGHNSVKKWDIQFVTNSGKALCLDLSTDGASGGDTYFYVNEIPLNDDAAYPNLYSRSRLWLVPNPVPAYENLSVSIYGYNSAYNDMKFNIIFRKIAATTESQCWNSMPAVSSKQGTVTFSPQAQCKSTGQC